MNKIDGPHLWCPIDFVIHIIGSRWTVGIVRELARGGKRPSELSRALGKISAKTLTQRLRELEESGLVARTAYQEIPPRVEYALTERGRDLLYVLEALKDLGQSWQKSMNIEIPFTVKEQCSHCFEYLGRNGQNGHDASVEGTNGNGHNGSNGHDIDRDFDDSRTQELSVEKSSEK